jgi:hypothetical protein
MIIPKTFEVFGHVIRVGYSETVSNESDAVGLAVLRENKIVIQRHGKQKPMTADQVGHTFYHELVHTIFDKLGEDDLNKNDQLVDLIGQCLYQYEKTKKGNLK